MSTAQDDIRDMAARASEAINMGAAKGITISKRDAESITGLTDCVMRDMMAAKEGGNMLDFGPTPVPLSETEEYRAAVKAAGEFGLIGSDEGSICNRLQSLLDLIKQREQA